MKHRRKHLSHPLFPRTLALVVARALALVVARALTLVRAQPGRRLLACGARAPPGRRRGPEQGCIITNANNQRKIREEHMKTKKTGPSLKARLDTGAAVIAAAQVTDVTLIKPRMTLFVSTHGDYVDIQAAVKAADSGRRKAKADVRRCADEQAAALEGVAHALVVDGAPRDTPFAAFESGAPFKINKLSLAEQAKAIRTLLEAIQESKTVSTAVRDAARTAEQAVAAVEAALLTLSKAVATARLARTKRAQLGKAWDQALAALKRAAHAAADDGAPGLYEALFGGLRRVKKKKAAAKPIAQKDTATTVTQPVTAPTVGSSPPVSTT